MFIHNETDEIAAFVLESLNQEMKWGQHSMFANAVFAAVFTACF
jgi:hypothetical protein